MDIKTKQTKFSGLQEKMCTEVYKVMRGRGGDAQHLKEEQILWYGFQTPPKPEYQKGSG